MSLIKKIKENQLYQDKIRSLSPEDRRYVEERSLEIANSLESLIAVFSSVTETKEGVNKILSDFSRLMSEEGASEWQEKP